jgi:hypothetical protein
LKSRKKNFFNSPPQTSFSSWQFNFHASGSPPQLSLTQERTNLKKQDTESNFSIYFYKLSRKAFYNSRTNHRNGNFCLPVFFVLLNTVTAAAAGTEDEEDSSSNRSLSSV